MLTGVVLIALGYWRFVSNEKLIESAGPRQAGGIQAEIAVSVTLAALVAVYPPRTLARTDPHDQLPLIFHPEATSKPAH